MAENPVTFTVEEAARILRIGRTKAYAMAQEWRTTGGKSGLPVIDFGNVLRVPRHALEQLLGADLTDVHIEHSVERRDAAKPAPTPEPEPLVVAESPAAPPATPIRRSRALRKNTPVNQLDLFNTAAS